MTKKKRGYILSVAVLALLLGICYFVFRDKLPEIMSAISGIPTATVAAILCAGMAYQLIDTAMCMVLVRSRVPSLGYGEAFELTMTGIFGMVCSNSVVTIPLQSLYLHTDGLDVGHTVGLMTVKYIFHKAAVLTLALVMLLFNFQWLRASVPDVMRYLLPGFAVCAAIITLLVLLCTWDKLRLLLYKILDRLPDKGRWGEKKALWRESIDLMYTEMRFLLPQKRRVAAVIALDVLKFTVVYAVPWLALRALGVSSFGLARGEFLSSLVWLIAGVLPAVSGLGPLDVAFALLFGNFAPESAVSAALVLYRASTYFVPFAVSLPTVFVMQRTITKRLEAKGADGGKPAEEI